MSPAAGMKRNSGMPWNSTAEFLSLEACPRDQDLHISERHLGLIPSLESGEAESIVERIGLKLEPYLDLDGILKIARESARPSHPHPVFPVTGSESRSASRTGGETMADRQRPRALRGEGKGEGVPP